MMNYIWAGMMLISLVVAAATGRMDALSDATMTGANRAVEVCLGFAGVMILWGGLMRIAERSGLTAVMGRICSPLLRLLFKGLPPKSPAARAISMNMAANFLGLGNAATPLGLEAMKALQRDNLLDPTTATRHMITFVVINTASIQLIPTTIAALRTKYASANPMEIMPAIWLASVASLLVGLLVNFLCALRYRNAGRDNV